MWDVRKRVEPPATRYDRSDEKRRRKKWNKNHNNGVKKVSVPSSVVAAAAATVMNAVCQSVLVWPSVWIVAKTVGWLGHGDLPSPQRRVWSRRMLSPPPSSVSGPREGKRRWKESEHSVHNPEPRVAPGNRSTNRRHVISKCPNNLFRQD